VKIVYGNRNCGAVASVIVLAFLSSMLIIIVARGRQVSSYKQSLALTEKKQDSAKKHWLNAAPETSK
jgi:hypothetical protein